MIIWYKKGQGARFVQFEDRVVLSQKEVDCHCSKHHCTQTLLATSVVASFRGLRWAFGKPIGVNSGFRCQEHNLEVGGKDQSFHKLGLALDLTADDLDGLEATARLYFEVVIRYDTFVHCHNLK